MPARVGFNLGWNQAEPEAILADPLQAFGETITMQVGGLRTAFAVALIALTATALAGCGGGGGGGGSTGTAVATTVAPAVAATPVGPSVTSLEFTRNYGVGAVKADAAWAQGASGRGITVAVIDTGVDGTGPDLTGRMSLASVDLNAARNQVTGSDRHATYVAGVIAANSNGQGTVGVAFESTILSVRAETSSTTCGGDVCFLTSDLARGIDYAVANGAKVINLSLGTGSGPAGPAFEAALQRATAAGLVVVAAAGNESTDAAHWPSGYAVDPRYAGSIIAVGSLNAAGSKSSFSNTAGAAGGGFLFAPGEAIVTDCNGASCRVVSGTSFAAPQVAGALALVLQAFPNMSGPAAVDLLWRSARDLGAPGNDPVYGWGALDLQRAFAPAGTLSVPVEGAGFVAESLAPGTAMGAAFGDAAETSGALRTVGWDYYQRPFVTDLGRGYAGARPAIVTPLSADFRQVAQADLGLKGGGRLSIVAGLAQGGPGSGARGLPWAPAEASRDVVVSFRAGRLGLSAWTGGGVANPFMGQNPDAFTALAQSDRAARADYAIGRWLVSAEAGAGARRSPDLLQRQDGAVYFRASGQTRRGPVRSTLTFGYLGEPLGPLGAYLPARSGLNLTSRTAFAAYGGVWALRPGVTVRGEASLGRTQADGRLLALDRAALSSAWRVALDGDCAVLGLSCGGLTLSVAQPLRIESGRFQALLAEAPSDYFASPIFTQRRFSASPSGRELDVTVSATRRTGLNGLLQLDAMGVAEPGHRAAAGPAVGLLASWRAAF